MQLGDHLGPGPVVHELIHQQASWPPRARTFRLPQCHYGILSPLQKAPTTALHTASTASPAIAPLFPFRGVVPGDALRIIGLKQCGGREVSADGVEGELH